MKQIRKGVFETNSSSTHSICIAKEVEISIPETIHFEFGEFGWECDTLKSIHEKASYLYTGLAANDRMSDFENIVEVLSRKGIEVTSDEPIYQEYTDGDNNTRRYVDNGGYVDHSNELTDFLDAVCRSDDKLLSYLFSHLSFIITGNDNNENDVDINVSYPHDEFYKGN